MIFKDYYTRFKVTQLINDIWAYVDDVMFKTSFEELDLIMGRAYVQMQDINYLELRYDETTTDEMMLSIWSKHLLRIKNIIDMNKEVANKGLNYKEEGHNKSSFGYGGYDLQNQDGQFQANINTVNLSKTNYKDIIDIINKQQYNIYGPLKEDIIDQLLVIIY